MNLSDSQLSILQSLGRYYSACKNDDVYELVNYGLVSEFDGEFALTERGRITRNEFS